MALSDSALTEYWSMILSNTEKQYCCSNFKGARVKYERGFVLIFVSVQYYLVTRLSRRQSSAQTVKKVQTSAISGRIREVLLPLTYVTITSKRRPSKNLNESWPDTYSTNKKTQKYTRINSNIYKILILQDQ